MDAAPTIRVDVTVRATDASHEHITPAYSERYPVGSRVRIAERAELQQFRAEWRFHDPLREEQLAWAGRVATVSTVGFYHGGDPLYELDGAPGVWHEPCLAPVGERHT
jgi:hypothetical protein